MKTYWDYTDQEQANLTEDEIKSLLDVELMTRGVKNAVAPVLAEIPKSPVGDRRKFYSLVCKGKYGSDEHFHVCFPTIEAAQAFSDLGPLQRNYDYEVGSEFEFVMPVSEPKIEIVELYAAEQINQFRSELKNRKAKTEANEQASREFKSACEKSEQVTSRVWSDWFAKRNFRDKMKSVTETYAEYLRLTNGDSNLALAFLSKVHNQGEIAKAREWFPDAIPEQLPGVAAEAQPKAESSEADPATVLNP